ncbi:MAG: tetratricopeptide repeat protein [Rhodospirillaceae bacterium]|nr:tetratricopeptide repeat protein [Rhodospirillaceae bacterium]
MRLAALLLFAFLCALGGTARADARADYAAAMEAAKKGKIADAITLMTRVIDSKEASGETLATMYYTRADFHSQMRKYDLAIADYTKAIEIMPDHAAAYGDRAVAYALEKKYTEALDDLSRCEFLVPKSPIPYFNRGRVYELMGNKPEAIAQYRKALELAPKMKAIQDALHRLGAK